MQQGRRIGRRHRQAEQAHGDRWKAKADYALYQSGQQEGARN